MSNLLLNATNWKDGSDTSPPICWDGTSYVALNQEEDLTLTASVAAGDVVACTLSSTDGIGTVKVNSSLGALLATWGPVTDPTDFSIAAQAGMVLQIDSALGCSSDTLTLTPTPEPAPVADYTSGYHSRLKEINVPVGATIAVANQWAAEAEKRGTTVSGSTWTYTGAGTLSGAALTTPLSSVRFAPTSGGTLYNTVTLANGEILVGVRRVYVQRRWAGQVSA